MFSPFLPNHINFVPQVGESVNIFYTDPEVTFMDGFYMPSSVSDRGYSDSTSAEHMMSQSKQGLNYKKAKDLLKDTGEYVKKKYDGALIKNEDIAISSRVNSDVIWSDNAIIIRAGKINEEISKKQKEPIRDENPAIIQVRKYDSTLEKVEGDTIFIEEKKFAHVEVLIEYFIEDLNATDEFVGNVYVYKVAKNEGDTETVYFNQTTEVSQDNKELLYSRLVTSDSLLGLSSNIRQTIKQIINKGNGGLDKLDFLIKHPSNVNPSKSLPIYPLYFRPSSSQYNSNNTNTTYIDNVLNRIHIKSRKGYGLIFDEKNDDTPTKNVEVKQYDIVKSDKPNKNILMLSDTNYFLAYGNNIPTESKGIDFSKVSNYNISQDEVINNIEPNTFALVRGEKLQELLDVIYLFLISHVHNPAEPAVVQPSVKQELEQKFQDFKQNILSQKIRIN